MHPPRHQSTELAEPYMDIIRKLRLRERINVLRAREAAKKAGIGLSTMWRDTKARTFVPPIRTGPRSVAWIEAEIDAVLEAKAKLSRSHIPLDMRAFVDEIVRSTR